MYDFLREKEFVVSQPAAIVNNGSLTCNVIDTLGYDLVEITLYLGATDIALTALKVQEAEAKSSATALTSGVDITASVFGTANNDTGSASTLPSATDDNKVYKFLINCKGARKRYLLPVVTIGNGSTGAFTTVVARLARAVEGPRTAADANVAQRMLIP